MQATTFKTHRLDFRNPKHAGTNELFATHWPDYKKWFSSKFSDAGSPQRIREGKKQLAKYMPEFLVLHENLCSVANGCPVAADFLTGYQPPAYLVSCSQAVVNRPQPTLIRNYDLSPDLSENVVSLTALNGYKVIGTNEFLWGLDDGMNDAGLAASLTFGGSKQVGQGFGVPFIMRYLLHSCQTVKQAIKVLKRIPSHMAYNVTLLDKEGDFATVFVMPDQPPIVTREPCATNHQQHVVWPEQAVFSKTVERKQYLKHALGQADVTAEDLLPLFLAPPLYSGNYAQQFGTVFTAIYQPQEGTMAYHWPGQPALKLSFAKFTEQDRTVQLDSHTYGHQSQVGNDSSGPAPDVSAYMPDSLREVLLRPLSYIPGLGKQGLSSQQSVSWRDYAQLYTRRPEE